MEYNLYSVYDRIDCAYGDILRHRSDARAVKTLVEQIEHQNKVADSKNLPKVDLNEFLLYKLGTMDDSTGVITPLDKPEALPLE